jgi:hypothetical protein
MAGLACPLASDDGVPGDCSGVTLRMALAVAAEPLERDGVRADIAGVAENWQQEQL